jgi:hypothetical protein
MKRISISVIVAISTLFSSTSFASFWGDLWNNPNESGWGLNITQQDQTLFATMFIYGADNRPSWFVASSMTPSGSGYLGDLYQTSGPAYFNSFNPNSVGIRKVGRIIFVPRNEGEAGISYEVDGLTVNKNIERQTFKTPNLTDTWLGNYRQRVSGCDSSASSSNGTFNTPFSLRINDSSTSTLINGTFTINSTTLCAFSGTRNNFGKIFNIIGNYSCPSGGGGPMTLFNGQYLETTISARIQLTNNANRCTTDGYFAGTTSLAP